MQQWFHPPRPFEGEPRIDETAIIPISPTSYTNSIHKYVLFDVAWDDTEYELDARLSSDELEWYAHGYMPIARYDPESHYIKLADGWKLHTKEYRQLQKLCAEKWGELARSDQERWFGLTDNDNRIIHTLGGCINWLGAYDEEGQKPCFKLNGRKINARAVPWTRKGRRTCGNSYCVRKQHAKGYYDSPDVLAGAELAVFEAARDRLGSGSIEQQFAAWRERYLAFRASPEDVRAVEVAREREQADGEPDNPFFELRVITPLPGDGEGWTE